MPNNVDFNPMSKTVEPIFGSVGAMEVTGSQESKSIFVGAYYDNSELGKGLYVVSPNSEISYFDLDKSQISVDGEFTNSVFFQDDSGASYYLRRINDEDGYWISKYQTEIPTQVLESKALIESAPAVENLLKVKLPQGLPFFEAMVMYYEEDMDTIYDIIYMSSAGSYKRLDAKWVSTDVANDKYEGLLVHYVDPSKADELVQDFDESGTISNNDTAKYSLEY